MSALDMASGYWAVNMREEDRAKTAFLTWSHGLLEWVRMPMGLRNSGATYQRMLQQVLGPLLWESSMNYLDDVSIFSNGATFEDHLDDLARVLKRLVRWGITVKLSKCLFCAKEMPFLGFVVKVGEGVKVDVDKVSAVLKAKPPVTVTECRAFLGSLQFYAKFIPDHSHLTAPLRRAIKGKTKRMKIQDAWEADPECDLCFRALKAALIQAPVLWFPDFARPFTLACDASKRQVAAVLMQRDDEGAERPVAFYSKQLSETEERYHITDRECLSVVLAFRRFRKYLHGSKFPVTVISDNKALSSIGRAPDPHGRLARYAMEMSEIDHHVAHRPGPLNFLPDMLTRCKIDGVDGEEMERVVDQALKDRRTVLVEAGRKVAVS